MTENYREIIKNNNFRFENYKLACKEEVVRDKGVLDDDMYSAIGEMYFY